MTPPARVMRTVEGSAAEDFDGSVSCRRAQLLTHTAARADRTAMATAQP